MRRTEALGIPSVMVCNSTYESTHYLGSLDNGIPNARRAVMDRKLYARTYGLVGTDFGSTGSGSGNSANERNDRTIRYFLSDVLTTPYPNIYNEGLKGKVLTPYEQVKWALSAPLSDNERNPKSINPALCGALDIDKVAELGASYNAETDVISFTSSSYDAAVQQFNKLAGDLIFQDGLPLTIPSPERVEAMLAATTRDRNDVLGKMKMRSGVITVEKVAVNAVMAGCKPEYFPVVLAALEMYANGWDDDMMWYHTMSSGGWYTLQFFISGPIVKELGLEEGRGYAASGNEANLTIGRAVRLCVRNIAHSTTPNIDTAQRQGRPNEHTLEVIAEQADELPPGWNPHHVEMGFAANQSTITLHGGMSRYVNFGGEPFAWTITDVFGANAFIRNFFGSDVSSLTIPPAMAREAYEAGYTTKLMFRQYLRGHTPGSTTVTNVNQVFVVVAGGDPGVVRQCNGSPYSTLNTGTQLITGATLTQAGTDPAPHSAPQDLRVIENADGSYTLRWKAPASATDPNRAPIQYYQIAYTGGSTAQNFTFAATASTVTVSATSPAGINPGQMVHRTVAQVTTGTTSEDGYYEFTYANNQIQPGTQCFFRVRAYNAGVAPASTITTKPAYANSSVLNGATGNARNYRPSGRGGWTEAIIITKPGTTVGLNAPYVR